MARSKSIQLESLLHDDIIIVVMGPTGVGKSSFINVATNSANAKVGNKLESCTSDIRAISYVSSETVGHRFVIVDTPGFNDTNKPDAEILSLIAEWLKTTYKRDVHIAGIIYLHRITDNRMSGSPLKNLRMFAKLCGDDALANVILATTMWDRVDPTTGTQRENELKESYWKGMVSLGSRIERFDGSFESAWAIIGSIARNKIDILLLQDELVILKRQLSETEAGTVLYNDLQKLLAEHKEILRKLRDEAAANKNEELRQSLDAEYMMIQQKLQSTFDQITKLKVPFGRRLVLFFSRKSRIAEVKGARLGCLGAVSPRLVGNLAY